MAARPNPLATAEDLLRAPGDTRREIVRGAIVEKAAPTGEHAGAQSYVTLLIKGPFHYRWTREGYVVALAAGQSDRQVRAEPFDAIELDVRLLFGEDPVE